MEKERMSKLGVTDMGIPSYDKEPANAKMVPLSNKFSAMHDCSADEAYRMVRGSTVSSAIKKGGY